jgi:hypothetical protein
MAKIGLRRLARILVVCLLAALASIALLLLADVADPTGFTTCFASVLPWPGLAFGALFAWLILRRNADLVISFAIGSTILYVIASMLCASIAFSFQGSGLPPRETNWGITFGFAAASFLGGAGLSALSRVHGAPLHLRNGVAAALAGAGTALLYWPHIKLFESDLNSFVSAVTVFIALWQVAVGVTIGLSLPDGLRAGYGASGRPAHQPGHGGQAEPGKK